MKAERAVSTLRSFESFPEKTKALVTVSMLSDEAKSNYVTIVRDRAQPFCLAFEPSINETVRLTL